MKPPNPPDWPGFIAQLGAARQVTLVGPLHDNSLQPSNPTVFIDGGARFLSTSASAPYICVGDGDSASAPLDVRLPAEKDYSDLAFVLRELPLQVTHLRLLGFCGGRLDHMLANLGELHAFLSKRADGSSAELESAGQVQVIGFKGTLDREVAGVFSLMVLERCEVTIEGNCKYPLKNVALEPASSHGLSNEGFGLVTVRSKGPCFLFLN